jgi:exopolysaccharide biosynthesis polyprenyl glycosylphosphotransferase
MVEFALSRSRARRMALEHLAPTQPESSSPEELPAKRKKRRDSVESLLVAPRIDSPGLAAVPTSGAQWASLYRRRLRLSDALIVMASLGLAFWARFGTVPGIDDFDGAVRRFATMSAIVAAVWIASLSVFRTRDARVVGVGADEYKRVVHSSSTTFGTLAVLFLVLEVDTARWFLTVAFPVGLGALLVNRWAWRRWLNAQRHAGHFLSRVIVIGDRADVTTVIMQIKAGSGAAYSVIGAVVEKGDSELPVGLSDDIVVLSDLSRAAEFARTLGVEGVVVAGHPRGGSTFIHDLAWQLEGTTAELILATSLANVAGPRIHFRPVEGLPLIHVEIPQFDGSKHLVKRAMDIVLSGAALLFLSPVFALIAILVKSDSEGGALFTQERVGRGGAAFRIYKFRSMNVGAPEQLGSLSGGNEGSGVLFKMKNDPRVTRLGRTLRKYSLDELPQLWNVFVGDMSLVGPRPPLPGEVSAYEDHVHRRLFIKPGLTGMWQVNGRSNLSWEDSVRLDLYYVENWSLMGDLIILWRTVKVVLQPVGAY